MEGSVAEARRRGYTATELGRRRYIARLLSDNHRIRQAAERQAMNAGIQGLAADIFKLALVRLDAALETGKPTPRGSSCRSTTRCSSRCPSTSTTTVEAIDEDAMEQAYPLRVPLEVHLSWGTTWAAAK